MTRNLRKAVEADEGASQIVGILKQHEVGVHAKMNEADNLIEHG